MRQYGATIVKRTVRILLLLIPWTLLGQQYDVLIRNGRVVDGTGNPWVYADVGVTRDRITLVGRAPVNATAKRVIDAKGMVVAPGFIDMLEQSEWNLLIDKEAFSKLTQGITTGITGEGGSIAPQNEQTQADRRDCLEVRRHLRIAYPQRGRSRDASLGRSLSHWPRSQHSSRDMALEGQRPTELGQDARCHCRH